MGIHFWGVELYFFPKQTLIYIIQNDVTLQFLIPATMSQRLAICNANGRPLCFLEGRSSMVHLFIDLQYSPVKNIWSICRWYFITHYHHLIHLQDPQAMIKVVSCFNPEIPTATDFAFRFTVPILPQLKIQIEAPGPAWSFCSRESDACKNLRANLKFHEKSMRVFPFLMDSHWLSSFRKAVWYTSQLVGGFNPFETYESKWESSPNVWNHHPVKCCLKLTSFWHCGKTPTICSRQLHQAFRKGIHCKLSNHCSAKQYFLEQGTSKSVVSSANLP